MRFPRATLLCILLRDVVSLEPAHQHERIHAGGDTDSQHVEPKLARQHEGNEPNQIGWVPVIFHQANHQEVESMQAVVPADGHVEPVALSQLAEGRTQDCPTPDQTAQCESEGIVGADKCKAAKCAGEIKEKELLEKGNANCIDKRNKGEQLDPDCTKMLALEKRMGAEADAKAAEQTLTAAKKAEEELDKKAGVASALVALGVLALVF